MVWLGDRVVVKLTDCVCDGEEVADVVCDAVSVSVRVPLGLLVPLLVPDPERVHVAETVWPWLGVPVLVEDSVGDCVALVVTVPLGDCVREMLWVTLSVWLGVLT